MAGIACGAVWFGGGGGVRMKACEYALDQIVDALDEDKNGKVSIDTFVKFMDCYGINITEEEVHKMEVLADDHGELGKQAFKSFVKNAWFWQVSGASSSNYFQRI